MADALTLHRPLPFLRDIAARGATLWRAHPREVSGVFLFGSAVAAAAAATGLSTGPAASQAAPPVPPSMTVRPLAPEQALKLNAEVPLAHGPNPAATPFAFKGGAVARAQALNCLANAVYYEAGNQDVDGERAVAQVVLNRVRHPAFPATICGVVYEGSARATGCQFTFTCDGSLNRQPDADGWRRAMAVAQAALNGAVYAPVGWATHYHADYVVPYWASAMAKNIVVGAHLFYRWPGGWGQPGAFTKAYAGLEPSASALKAEALATAHEIPQTPGALANAIARIPGAEPLKLSPSLRGDKRVAVRFNLTARAASESIRTPDYSQKFAASDNLKWSLSSNGVAENQRPLGRESSAAAGGAVGAR